MRCSKLMNRFESSSGYSDNLLTQYGTLQADVNLMRKPFKNEELLGKVQALICD